MFFFTGKRVGDNGMELHFRSPLYSKMIQKKIMHEPTAILNNVVIPPWLLGDKGFPIRVYCMPIIKLPANRVEERFNERLS
jgi:hypothetical protein